MWYMLYKAHKKHIEESTKRATRRMKLNMPHNMSEILREDQTTTIIQFLTETKIINIL